MHLQKCLTFGVHIIWKLSLIIPYFTVYCKRKRGKAYPTYEKRRTPNLGCVFDWTQLLLNGSSLLGGFSLLQECADGQADLLVLVVDVDDLSINDLTDLQLVSGLTDLVISDLRNVDQTVHTVNDLSECTEGHQVDDLNGCGITNSVLSGEDEPGVGCLGLVAQGDALLLCVVALDDPLARLSRHISGFLLKNMSVL